MHFIVQSLQKKDVCASSKKSKVGNELVKREHRFTVEVCDQFTPEIVAQSANQAPAQTYVKLSSVYIILNKVMCVDWLERLLLRQPD